MFEVALTFFSQLVGLIPYIIALFLIFEFTGSLLFERR